MKKILCLLSLVFLVGCTKADENSLKPFRSDGCSLFPDSSLISNQNWCACCFEHDLQYWRGGTEDQRLEADQKLKDCILDKTKNRELAELMYQGVRFGGSPYFYNWYRWGYGWDYTRKYAPLSEAEITEVSVRMDEYYKNPLPNPCGESAKTTKAKDTES